MIVDNGFVKQNLDYGDEYGPSDGDFISVCLMTGALFRACAYIRAQSGAQSKR